MNKPHIGIIDYKMGNMFSVIRACEHVDLYPVLTSDKNDLNRYDALILPGVGAFGEAMSNLKKLDLVETIKEFIASGKPFMGICLGLQLLFSESEEFGRHKGLDIIRGEVKHFPARDKVNNTIKVPQVGWNKIHFNTAKCGLPIFNNINNDEYMYFVHSYYVAPENQKDIVTLTEYAGVKFCSSIARQNIFATQFHPEKSGEIGLTVYKNFAASLLRPKVEYRYENSII